MSQCFFVPVFLCPSVSLTQCFFDPVFLCSILTLLHQSRPGLLCQLWLLQACTPEHKWTNEDNVDNQYYYDTNDDSDDTAEDDDLNLLLALDHPVGHELLADVHQVTVWQSCSQFSDGTKLNFFIALLVSLQIIYFRYAQHSCQNAVQRSVLVCLFFGIVALSFCSIGIWARARMGKTLWGNGPVIFFLRQAELWGMGIGLAALKGIMHDMGIFQTGSPWIWALKMLYDANPSKNVQ